MRRLPAFLGVLAVCWSGGTAGAALSLQLSSSDDLTALVIGDTATIDVSLAGLPPGEQLVSLTASVLFPAGLLGTPPSISPGAIVPNPGDFLSVGLAGQADGVFLTFSPDPADRITTDGVFYSFDVQAQSVGSGAFTLDSLALIAEQYDPQNPLLPMLQDVTPGALLPFSISVIPAPPALGLALLGLAMIHWKSRSRTA